MSTAAQMAALALMILGFLALIIAVTGMILHADRRAAEREYQSQVEKRAAQRDEDTRAWFREYREHGVIYPELSPEALDADAERLARTADLPAVDDLPAFAPRLVPLPEAGTIEPAATFNPGEPLPEPLPEGEIAGWVKLTLAGMAPGDDTFIRRLWLDPLPELAGAFDRPLALTAGGES